LDILLDADGYIITDDLYLGVINNGEENTNDSTIAARIITPSGLLHL
jgi:hypothetical protein